MAFYIILTFNTPIFMMIKILLLSIQTKQIQGKKIE